RTCLASASFALLACGMMHRLYQEPTAGPGERGTDQAGRLSLRQAFALPSFGALVALMFFINFIERSFAPVLPLYVQALGAKSRVAETAGLILSLGLLAEGVSATVIGNRLRRAVPRRLLLWRLSGGALILFPMGLATSTTELLALRVMLGLLAGGCMVVVYTLGSRIIPTETRATSFAFLSSSALVGGALGPIAAGAV